MRQHIDADAERLQRGHAFKDLSVAGEVVVFL